MLLGKKSNQDFAQWNNIVNSYLKTNDKTAIVCILSINLDKTQEKCSYCYSAEETYKSQPWEGKRTAALSPKEAVFS